MQRTLVNEDTILKKDKSPVTGSSPYHPQEDLVGAGAVHFSLIAVR